MTKRRSGPDKDDKDDDSDVDEGVDDGDEERLLFKMIVGESAVWTPGEYREVSCRPHRNPIFR